MYLASKIYPPPAGAARSASDMALDELDSVYAFIYSRVSNRADAEDLTQQVALKALARLHDGAPAPAIRGYLYATARSVLATFWSSRLRLHESELPDNVRSEAEVQEFLPSPATAARVDHILECLAPKPRRVLELRFLRGYSLREVADEMATSVGNVKIMQLRALRKAAAIGNRQEESLMVASPAMSELATRRPRRAV